MWFGAVKFYMILCALPLAQTLEERKERRLSVLMLSFPFAGHLGPTIALGEELVRRGHNVTLCTIVDEREKWSERPKKMAERAHMNLVSASGGEQLSLLMRTDPKEPGLSMHPLRKPSPSSVLRCVRT